LMELVEIDPVRSEPAETVLAGASDVVGLRPFSFRVDLHPELRGQDDPVASPLEGAAQELLALRAAVDVGRVEESDSGVECGVDDCPRCLEVEPSAEVVASETGDRNLEGSELDSSHVL